MRALLFALSLAACSADTTPHTNAADARPMPTQTESAEAALADLPTWADARATGVDFRAVGQEPGWFLDIYQRDRIVLLWDYGEHRAEFPLVAPAYPREGAVVYDTTAGGHTLTVTTRRAPCEDVMSGEAYPATVAVEIDGRTLQGCGRSV